MSRLLVALLLALGATLASAQENRHVTHVYDVRGLIAHVKDDAGPAIGLSGRSSNAIEEPIDENDPLTADALASLLKQNVDPEQWQGATSQLKVREGSLVVTAPKETHQKIQSALSWMRAKGARTVLLEVRVYRAPGSALAAMLTGGPVLDEARAKALAAAPWTLRRRARLQARSGQRVNLARVRTTRFVRDFDVEVAENAHIYDPEIGALQTGTVDDIRATLSDDGRSLIVTSRLAAARLTKLHRFASGLLTKSGKPLAPLEQPQVASHEVNNTLWMPSGATAITAVHREGGQVELTVLRHIARAVKLPAEPPTDGKRMVKVIDARYACFSARDFERPTLAPQVQHHGPGATFDDDGGDEGAALSTEALMEMIRSNVDEDSWHNSRNNLASIAGRLTARQTPKTMAAIVDYLRKLERIRSISLLTSARLFKASDDVAGEVADLAGEALSAEQKAKLLTQLQAGSELTEVDTLAVSALPSQRVFAATLDDRLILGDGDVEVAEDSGAQDPEVRQIRSGSALDVRPTLVQQGGKVQLELDLVHVQAGELRELAIDGSAKLQLPSRERFGRKLTLVVTDGRATVIDLGGGLFALIEVNISRAAR